MKLTLCMIVKNEEEVLARCLSSLGDVFDEIVIVDTGSTDKTKEIAQLFTPFVYDFVWVDDFSVARNFSFSKATGDYVMWLDADDVLIPTEQTKLKKFKQTLDGSVDCYFLQYAIAFDQNENPTFCYYRERILKNDGSFVWVDPVHEVITPHGKTQYEDITIYHKKQKPSNPKRNLAIYQKLIQRGQPLSPRQQFYYARELYHNGQDNEAILEFEKFLTSGNGWVENCIEACFNLGQLYHKTDQPRKAKQTLYDSFNYDLPRGEICCELANIFVSENNYTHAIFWLETALRCKPNLKGGGFVLTECYQFIPILQLCYCHYKLGNITLSKQYHLLSKTLNPTHPSVIHNEKFFNEQEKQSN